MTISQLNYVVAVDKYRNFVEAARHCFVTQPTLSMQIKKLEEALDVVIFDRSKQPVVPTVLGEKFIGQARIVLREAARLEEIINEERGQIKGNYRLGIIPTLASTVLPLFLREFSKEYPDVNLIIQELQTRVMEEMLEEDTLDGGIAVTPLENRKIVEHPLFYEPFYLFVSTNHPLASSQKVMETELANQEVWLLNEGHCFRNQVIKLCRMQEGADRSPSVRFESGNLQTLIRLVEQDFGMTLLPYLLIREFERPEQKNMVRPFTPPVPIREVSLIHRRQVVKKNITEALISAIRKTLPPELRQKTTKDHHLLNPF